MLWFRTRSERCNLVKYFYPVIYWGLYKVRVGVRVGDRSCNMHGYNCSKLLELLVIVTNNFIRLTTFGSAVWLYFPNSSLPHINAIKFCVKGV